MAWSRPSFQFSCGVFVRHALLRSALGGLALSLATATLSGVSTSASASVAAAESPEVRIGSFNIRAGADFGEYKNAVTALKPKVDVAGLQEIGSTERNQWLKSDVDWGYHTSEAVQQNPIIWSRARFDVAGFQDYKIAEDRDVKGGPKGASWATGVRLIDRASGQQISVLNVHLVKGAVKGGLPVPGRKALFRLFAEQMAGTVQAIKAERAVADIDQVYILGDFNVGYEADVKRKHKKLPYRQYTALGMRSMWKGSPYLDAKRGTHSEALLDQVWTTENSVAEKIYYGIDQSDHWPAVATYRLAPVPGHVPVTGSVGFDQGYMTAPAKEGTGKQRDFDLSFDLVGDTDHGYPRLAFTGTATKGVLYDEPGSDYLVDYSELYDGKPGATIYIDFHGDSVDEPDEDLTITLVDPVNTEIIAGMESVTGTIRDDDK